MLQESGIDLVFKDDAFTVLILEKKLKLYRTERCGRARGMIK